MSDVCSADLARILRTELKGESLQLRIAGQRRIDRAAQSQRRLVCRDNGGTETGHRDPAHAQRACVKPLHGILPRRRARRASTLMTAAGALWRHRDGRKEHSARGGPASEVRRWADDDETPLQRPTPREEKAGGRRGGKGVWRARIYRG